MATTPAPEPAASTSGSLVVLAPVSAFAFGFTSGLVSSSKLAAKQFLAENAHRLPTTVQGWYFYQKTKNYRVLWAGIRGGLGTGSRLALGTAAFLALQHAFDTGLTAIAVPLLRGSASPASARAPPPSPPPTKAAAGALAGLTLAAAASWYYRLSRHTVPRRLALGLALGAAAGGSVDLRDWLRSRLPSPPSPELQTVQ